MKKKIKDLTLEECKKICRNTECCDDCPLFYGENKYCRAIELAIIENNKSIDLEIEVEVDEK